MPDFDDRVETYKKRLCERLAEIFSGESQQTTAARLNTVQSNVSKWVNGTAVPPVDTLVRISKVYAVSVDWLLGFTELKKTDSISYTDLTYEHIARIFDFLFDKGAIEVLARHDETEEIVDSYGEDAEDENVEIDEDQLTNDEVHSQALNPDHIEIRDRAISFILRQRYKMKELDEAYLETWKAQLGSYANIKLLDFKDKRIQYAIDLKNWSSINKHGDWALLLQDITLLTDEELDEIMKKKEGN